MQPMDICQLLQNSLNPALTNKAGQILFRQIEKPNFLTNLLIIGDNTQYKISIRQSALIYVKNALNDAYKQRIKVPDDDFQTVKSSILQALIRNCQQTSLTPTLRQIIFILAQYQYPHNWSDIIPQISNNIQNSSDFNQIFGSIQALKAIVSVFGKSIDQKVTLQNLANKIVLPLLSLASKLFQNYNQTTSVILISIFKIFSTLTFFYVPQIIFLNMHSWMIFIKKILDLNIESTNIDLNMYHLKKICLRIMFRFYQRHMKRKCKYYDQNVIDDFHKKFTRGIVQSLLLQIINETQMSKTNKNYIQLTKFSVSCLAFIYEEDRNAAILIDNYRDKIIYICLQRYKLNLNKGYDSYNQFSTKLKSQRIHLCSFIKALIKNQTKVLEQVVKGNYNFTNLDQLSSLLGSLFTHIQKGNMQIKQICLYIFSDIAEVLPQVDSQIQNKMTVFITNIVKPLLKANDAPLLIRLRCCQIISKYSYIQIPQNQLENFGAGVYECLISNNNQPGSGDLNTFLQISAVYAFNSLLRYDYIVNFTAPFLSNILQVYTSLLQIQISLIKCLEDMLGKFQSYLQPYGNNLIELLVNMYFRYHELVQKTKNGQTEQGKINSTSSKINYSKQEEQQQDSQDEEGAQSIQNNYLNASNACLGAVRRIIQSPTFQLEKQQIIHNLLVFIFSEKQSLNTEEAFNILNQILFKFKKIPNQYNIYFSMIIFGILPLNADIVDKYKQQNSNYTNSLLRMLQATCFEPDEAFIQDSIGCLRNFISKHQKDLKSLYDKSGYSFLQLLLMAVKHVHQNNSGKATLSDRSIILTIYISLIQWNCLNGDQIKQILQNVGNWLGMEKQVISKQQNKKPLYSPIYIQIILLCVHSYPQVTLNIVNGDWISTQLLQNWEKLLDDFSLSRLLIGVADLLSCQSVSDKVNIAEIMNRIPEAIQRECKIRMNQNVNDIRIQDQQAIEQDHFGLDQNTHVMGWADRYKNYAQNNNKQVKFLQMDEQAEEQQGWDEQFNKYYLSPFDNIDQIVYIYDALRKEECGTYMSLMRNDMQQRLSYLILNAPQKFPQNQNN